jgi:DNA-binding transcriptional LysR family regulator
VLNQHLNNFCRLYPALELEILSGAARPDLLHDRLDLIIQPTAPEDSSFIGIKLCRGQTDYYASPGYISQHGEPQHPGDLCHHLCIAELDHNRQVRPWPYREGSRISEARITPQISSDSIATVRSLAEQGLGVAVLPQFYCRQRVASGQLTALFQDNLGVARDIYGIYSSRRLKPRKLEVFLEFIKKALPEEI